MEALIRTSQHELNDTNVLSQHKLNDANVLHQHEPNDTSLSVNIPRSLPTITTLTWREVMLFCWPNNGLPGTRDIPVYSSPLTSVLSLVYLLMMLVAHWLRTVRSLPAIVSCSLLPFITLLSSRCWWCVLLQPSRKRVNTIKWEIDIQVLIGTHRSRDSKVANKWWFCVLINKMKPVNHGSSLNAHYLLYTASCI